MSPPVTTDFQFESDWDIGLIRLNLKDDIYEGWSVSPNPAHGGRGLWHRPKGYDMFTAPSHVISAAEVAELIGAGNDIFAEPEDARYERETAANLQAP
jgi:hypothetical protein